MRRKKIRTRTVKATVCDENTADAVAFVQQGRNVMALKETGQLGVGTRLEQLGDPIA